MRNRLTNSQVYRLCRWLEDNHAQLNGKSLQQLADCAATKLHHDVTVANVKHGMNSTGLEWAQAPGPTGMSRAALVEALAQAETRIIDLESSIEDHEDRIKALEELFAES